MTTTRSAAPSGALLLSQIGEALYGEQWQSPLARALDVNLRTMQRWAAGQNDPPEHLREDMIRLLHDRQQAISELLARLNPARGSRARSRS